MTDILMPRLSDSMEEGTVLRWLRNRGDTVTDGEELVEIETDKATMTYESPAAGVLADPVPEGGSYPVGAVIATVGAPGASSVNGQAPASEKITAVQAPAPILKDRDDEVAERLVPGVSASFPPALSGIAALNRSALAGSALATPLARRVAAVHGVDLSTVSGNGPRGRITRSDVAAAAGLVVAAPSPRAPAPSPAAPAVSSPPIDTPSGSDPRSSDGGGTDTTVQELTRTQQTIARRMAQSKATVPHFQVQTDAALDAMLELRGQLKAHTDRHPSINDFIVKACALALRGFPLANGSYRDGRFELHDHINVGIAVATNDALIVPTVTDADRRSLGEIASETRRLATAVREGTITPAELSGATFTVSNLGMYGMTAITPVVNVPQAGILGVGAARPVLTRVDAEIIERQIMTLTLSCDHRILYGATAAQFLSRVRELLETPLLIAL
jgi:pyruvate dehydrogenase E2 component (dihydrolipoamide acetyltransferase)